MASLSSQRIGNTITWTLDFITKSRSLAFSFSSKDRVRPHRRHQSRHSQLLPHSRQFSTHPHYRQEVLQPQTAPTSSTSQSRPQPIPKPNNLPPPTARNDAANPTREPINIVTSGLSDSPLAPSSSETQVDWTSSFHGLSTEAFPPETSNILLEPISQDDIEVKPDGILYLPEIKYRRILNRAFGPGGWGLAPRGETIVTAKSVTREYALLALGRLISISRGEQDYFEADGIPTATEGCKSNALMRCCKDLGVASELWDPRFIRKFVADHVKEVWVEHIVSKKRRKISMRKDDVVRYPYKEAKMNTASGQV